MEKDSATEHPEGLNYLSISSFLKENKELEKKLELSKAFFWVELAFRQIKSYR